MAQSMNQPILTNRKYAYNERTDLKVADEGYIDFLKRQILGISSDMKLNELEDARAREIWK